MVLQNVVLKRATCCNITEDSILHLQIMYETLPCDKKYKYVTSENVCCKYTTGYVLVQIIYRNDSLNCTVNLQVTFYHRHIEHTIHKKRKHHTFFPKIMLLSFNSCSIFLLLCKNGRAVGVKYSQ
jgi:hypothetical protein